MTQLTLRPPRPADIPAINDLFNRVSREQFGTDDSTEDEVRLWLGLPTVDTERGVVLAFSPAGELVGYGDLYDDAGRHTRLYLDVREDPARSGVAAEVLRALEERARELAALAPTAEQVLLRAYVPSEAESLTAMLVAAGYRPVRHSFRMVAELDGPPRDPRWPAGVDVRTFDRKTDARRVFDVQNETFADAWEYKPGPFEEWESWFFGDEHDPSLWFLAVDGDEIAAIALCRPHETGDEEMGWVSILGVRRAWRRRGLGLALLQHVFGEFQRRGRKRVGLGVDAESPTGAVGLYERAGMSVARTSVTYEKALDRRPV